MVKAASVGVDSVTDESSDAVGSVSGKQMGEGSSSGTGGGTDLTPVLYKRLLTQKIRQKGLLRTQEVGSW
jgi:hypothetical protein